MVADTTFIGFLDPSDFVRTSLIPASSKTDLTAAPAITPVPDPAVSYTHMTLPTKA